MSHLLNNLYNDERGFIVSGELVLVSTIAVLGLIVGLSEVAGNINAELEDVGSAIGAMNQSFKTQGACGHYGNSTGSKFRDMKDACDSQGDIQANGSAPESGCYN